MAKVLKEVYALSGNPMIEESVDALGQKKKHLYMQGLFLQGEEMNRNGRIYPKRIIESAVKSLQDRLAAGETIFGELDHPEELTINSDRISHMIQEIHMEGNDGIGKLKVFDDPRVPMGYLVAGIIENGGKLGVSSRGSGELDEYTGIVKDYEISTIDIVSMPSAQKAMPKSLYESIFNTSKGRNTISAYQGHVEGDSAAQKYFCSMMTKFIDSLL